MAATMPTDGPRRSPAAARALRILEMLALDRSRGLTLTELRQRLRFSHGNVHAILATMEAAGHVRRDPATKAYFLGPALLAIGAAAAATYPAVEVALPHMEALAAELDTECRASMRAGDELLVVARVGPQPPEGYGVLVGERFPLTPPLGLAYVAWSSEEEVDAYLAEAGDDAPTYRRAIATLRERGYSVAREVAPRRALVETATRILDEASREGYEEQLTALAHELGRDYTLGEGEAMHVGAPVFDADGTVALVIGVRFASLAGRTVDDVGERVVATTTTITRALARPR